MIGHLQRNKVRQVIEKAYLIHSVDSLRLAQQIEQEAAKLEKTVSILVIFILSMFFRFMSTDN